MYRVPAALRLPPVLSPLTILQRLDSSVTITPMALTIVVTLEKEIPEAFAAYTKTATGKALAREADRVDTAARRVNVTAITSLLSENNRRFSRRGMHGGRV